MKNPKMNKKNKLPLLLGILLLISAAAYGTRAYFTDSATEQAGIELKLGNVAVKSESSDWKYNREGEGEKAILYETTDLDGNKKVSYTNVSPGDTFTKNFIFKNTGSLAAKIKLSEQDIVNQQDVNSSISKDKVYSYAEGPYSIKITSNEMKFTDLISGTKLESDGILDIQMEISLNPKLDNKYNDNGKDEDKKDLSQVALDLLENKVTVELMEVSKK